MKFLREKLEKDFSKAGLTQQELAEKSGIPQSTISTVLNGGTNCPKPNTVEPIAKALGKNWMRYYTS